MSFLNPLFLAALAAVAIPLVVHMLSRRRVPVFYFSSLRFLRASDRHSMKRVNLRRILLMILRMAGVALLALAFARPVVRGGVASLFPGGGSRAGCILLDRSYSMGVESDEGTLFETAKTRVREILEQFAPEDEITIIVFDTGRERIYRGGGDERAIGLYLDETTLSYGTTDLRRAVGEGLEALRESRRESRELYIVSDFQRSSLAGRSAREGIPRLEDGVPEASVETSSVPVRAFLVKVGREHPGNAAIERVTAPGVTLHSGEVVTVHLSLAVAGGDTRFPVELHIDGKRILERELEIGPSRAGRAEFSFPVERSGWLKGEVRKRSDRLRADDRRFFVLRVVERAPVLLVADERALYIEQALSPEGADTDIALELKRYGELISEDLDRADVVVLGPGEGLRLRDVTLVERFVENGGKVLVLLLPELEGAALALSGHPLSIEWMEPGEGFVTIREPVAPPYFLKPLGPETEAAITRLRFRSAAFASGVPREEALLLFSNGFPFMWEEARGEGSMLFCAIDPVPEAGDLVLSPFFLPIVQQAVLVKDRTAPEDGFLIGGAIRWRGMVRGEARCELPAGGTEADRAVVMPAAVKAERGEDGGRIEELLLPEAASPGFVTLTAGGDTLAVFAINPDCDLESDLTPATGDEAADSLGLEHYVVVDAGASLSKAVGTGREGREITLQLAVAAILLFVIESAVAQRRYEGGEGVG
jgi:hypothetical protein